MEKLTGNLWSNYFFYFYFLIRKQLNKYIDYFYVRIK
jgi:hypothetical protein